MSDYSLKYPRTYHLPWSKGATNDDKIQTDLSALIGEEIVALEKVDGSNACLEKSGVFARTHSHAPTHPSFDWLKGFHQGVKWNLKEDHQYFGENLYAVHSIEYSELPGFFLLFGMRDVLNDRWYSWHEVEWEAKILDLPTVPILFRGKVNSEKELKELTESLMKGPSNCGGEKEGIVVRVSNCFKGGEFERCLGKIVRANHITTDDHWAFQEMRRNKLRKP